MRRLRRRSGEIGSPGKRRNVRPEGDSKGRMETHKVSDENRNGSVGSIQFRGMLKYKIPPTYLLRGQHKQNLTRKVSIDDIRMKIKGFVFLVSNACFHGSDQR